MISCHTANGQAKKTTSLHLLNVFERDGEAVVVGWRRPPEYVPGKPIKPVALPPLTRVPVTTVDRLRELPMYAPILKKYPDLTRRQQKLETEVPGRVFDGSGENTPLYQMFDRWLGARRIDRDYYEIEADGRIVESRLEILVVPPHTFPFIFNARNRAYVQCPADLVKPVLLHIGDSYYSVYGDCRVAQHVSVQGFPEYLAALRHAGNPLFACSQALPPVRQSYGVDKDDVIWIADTEGHIAFFDSKTSKYVQRCITVDHDKRVLIPRDNPSRSVFAFAKGKEGIEFRVEPGGRVAAPEKRRALPSTTTRILHCDADRIVFLAEDRAVMRTKDKQRSVDLGIKKGQKIWEGLFLPRTGEVCLLVGTYSAADAQIHEAEKLGVTRKSWNSLRLIRVNIPEKQEAGVSKDGLPR